ncbi:MAG: DUF2815 family protein [Devosia sp.]
MADPDFIMLKDVRVSFPHLFARPVINGEEGKCGAVLMLENDRHAKQIADVKARMDELAKEKFKGRTLPGDKMCLRAGEDRGRPEYEGYQVLSANSRGKPFVIGTDGRSMVTAAEDCAIYAGCYVNAKVRIWAQDNNYGKRINCELVAIQFSRDGEPLDGSYVSAEDAVSGFGEGDDEDSFLAA